MYELTSQHQKDMKGLENDYEEKIKGMKKQITMLQRHKEEMNLQQALERKQLDNKEKQWKQTNNMLQTMINRLEERIQSSQRDHEDIYKEKESFYSLRMKQLEQEIEEVKEKASQEIADNSKKSEEAFAVLKQYSEMEKQQWEKRLVDDREKSERKLSIQRDDYEKKLQE